MTNLLPKPYISVYPTFISLVGLLSWNVSKVKSESGQIILNKIVLNESNVYGSTCV